MNRKRFKIVFSILMIAALLLGASAPVIAQGPQSLNGGGPTHTKKGKITQADRQAAANNRKAQLKAAGVTAAAPAAMAPMATPDYFGATPNWALSPLPPTVTITDPTGTGASAVATVQAGVVTAIMVTNAGTGYTAPVVTIAGMDGSGATATATVAGGAVTGIAVNTGGIGYGGIRKFVDGLPGLCGLSAPNNLGQCLPIATPNITTYSDADYYIIELGKYTEKLHSDLPATQLEGYRQIDAAGNPLTPFSYLGPTIVAKSGHPVRVKFINHLGVGTAGDLFLPVDTTIMGAGMGPAGGTEMYTENRATLHLHGGTTPWISDGTQHQWTTPAGQVTSYPQGVSVKNVPDMDGGVEPQGTLTFYYTNQQSARLMFYHDHAYGITRLNVYAGQAAGYLLRDDAEAGMETAGVIPGLGDNIPLVIQDKTFVPGPNQLTAQDPTWNNLGFGNLWFPHVYMPNQNPWDVSGANAMGRWDYGPWFWPPFTGITNGETPNPLCRPKPPVSPLDTTYDCSAAPWEPPFNPGTPNPSIVPEGFMDTPLVNGTAYPTLTVDPRAYRFRILSAGNDRTLDLSLYQAGSNNPMWDANGNLFDPNAGEVPMVPANPNPTIPFPVDWTTASGGTGIRPDILDGRISGVPDPRYLGPSWIQIGTEGGFLPAPVVLDPKPTGYEYNLRNIVVLNITKHSLLLGPAERADVIVDFSQYAGKTLILYNDGPAPVPAGDPRTDYYTGGPDFTSTGGAPTTLPGYGPNTRTIMQIKVKGSVAGGTSVQSLTLKNGGSGYTAPSVAISGGGGTSAAGTVSGAVSNVTLSNAGSGYVNPTISFSGGGGSGATASASGSVSSLTLTNPGAGYASMPSIGITGGGGSLAAAFATGTVDALNLTAGGGGFTSPTVSFSGGGGTGATASATGAVDAIAVTNSGGGYLTMPTLTIPGGATATATGAVDTLTLTTPGSGYTTPVVTFTGDGTGATASVTGAVDGITLSAGGMGYTSAPAVSFSGGGGTGAAATVTGAVNAIAVTTPGTGYTAPVVTIADSLGGTGSGATATATIDLTGAITAINVSTPGSGYTAPVVTITDTAPGIGSGATASATMTLSNITLTSFGSGYSAAPTVSFGGGGGIGAAASTTVSVTGITLGFAGAGYSAAPAISIVDTLPGTGAGATATTTLKVNAIAVTAGGSGYATAPAVSFSSGLAAATATLKVTALTLTNGGAGYTSAPAVSIVGGAGAAASSTLKVSALTITSPGTNYTSTPTISFIGGGGSGASAMAGISALAIMVTNGGSGYTSAPAVTISGGGGTGASAVATIKLTAISLTASGSGYTSAPQITISDTGAGTGALASANLTPGTAYNLAGLQAALPVAYGQTQPKPLVPEPQYNAPFNATYPINYVRIQDNSTSFTNGTIGSFIVTNGGGGYTSVPAVTVTGGGSGAAGTAVLAPINVASFNVTAGGSGYTSAPSVVVTGGGGTGAAGTSVLATFGSVKSIAVTASGSGYTSIPAVTLTGGGTGATAVAVVTNRRVTAINVTNSGTGYASAPAVLITGGGGTGATGVATLGKAVASITLTNGGSGYTSAPTVSFSGGGGSGATGTATLGSRVVASVALTSAGSGYTSVPTVGFSGGGGSNATAVAVLGKVLMQLQPKAIQELFDPDYGRMNALLGVEIPNTTGLNQTTIPYTDIDPATEIFKSIPASDSAIPIGTGADGTQIWKITHNGVDTHAIHWHMFNVQIVNRVGWDGAVRFPDANELGWKDTVRMSPLEDIIVALRPIKPNVPWDLPNSVRALDVTAPLGSVLNFQNVDPYGHPAAVTNQLVNFGWEYVWHCHLLGHEENIMMRPIIFGVAPNLPGTPVATLNLPKAGQVTVTWADNSLNETSFTIQRATNANGPWTTLQAALPANTVAYVDKAPVKKATNFYRVVANNRVGYLQTYAAPAVGYPNTTISSLPTANSNSVTP